MALVKFGKPYERRAISRILGRELIDANDSNWMEWIEAREREGYLVWLQDQWSAWFVLPGVSCHHAAICHNDDTGGV